MQHFSCEIDPCTAFMCLIKPVWGGIPCRRSHIPCVAGKEEKQKKRQAQIYFRCAFVDFHLVWQLFVATRNWQLVCGCHFDVLCVCFGACNKARGAAASIAVAVTVTVTVALLASMPLAIFIIFTCLPFSLPLSLSLSLCLLCGEGATSASGAVCRRPPLICGAFRFSGQLSS